MILEIKCPFCGRKQTQEPVKSWKYNNATDVGRYQCSCKKFFHFFKGSKKNWTIPKVKKVKDQKS